MTNTKDEKGGFLSISECETGLDKTFVYNLLPLYFFNSMPFLNKIKENYYEYKSKSINNTTKNNINKTLSSIYNNIFNIPELKYQIQELFKFKLV